MEQVTVSYGPEYAGVTVRLYASLASGSPAEIPFTALNAEKWALQADGFALAAAGRLDSAGKITFVWESTLHADGRLQAAVELVDGWRLSEPLAYIGSIVLS